MSLQTRLAALVSAIGTDIKALTTGVAQAEKRAVLIPDTNSTVDEASAVVWKRTSDGAYVAYSSVQENLSAPNRAYVKTDSVDSEGTGYGQQTIQARGLVGGNRRAATLILAGSPSSRYVRAMAETDGGGVQSKLIIDSAGKSDFLGKVTQLANDQAGPSPSQGNGFGRYYGFVKDKTSTDLVFNFMSTLVPGSVNFASFDLLLLHPGSGGGYGHIGYAGQFFNRTGQHELAIHPGLRVSGIPAGDCTFACVLGGTGVSMDSNDRTNILVTEVPIQ